MKPGVPANGTHNVLGSRPPPPLWHPRGDRPRPIDFSALIFSRPRIEYVYMQKLAAWRRRFSTIYRFVISQFAMHSIDAFQMKAPRKILRFRGQQRKQMSGFLTKLE